MASALLIIDVQNDFCNGGSLAVPDANNIIPIVNELKNKGGFDHVLLSQDFHPSNHMSFASNNPGTTVFQEIELPDKSTQVMWPNHCVQGTVGCLFHPDLVVNETDVVVKKGTDPTIDSYSAFFDNGKKKQTDMDRLLRERNVDVVFLCGLATDYCVSYSALDAVAAGFKTYFIQDASRGIAQEGIDKQVEKMKQAGIVVVNAKEVFDIVEKHGWVVVDRVVRPAQQQVILQQQQPQQQYPFFQGQVQPMQFVLSSPQQAQPQFYPLQLQPSASQQQFRYQPSSLYPTSSAASFSCLPLQYCYPSSAPLASSAPVLSMSASRRSLSPRFVQQQQPIQQQQQQQPQVQRQPTMVRYPSFSTIPYSVSTAAVPIQAVSPGLRSSYTSMAGLPVTYARSPSQRTITLQHRNTMY